MKIGYARVSTYDQKLSYQIDALEKEGCEKIFSDVISGSKTERTGLDETLSFAREGDIIVVWRLDRLGRSVTHLINIIQKLNESKIGFKSIQESIDTTTPTGMLTFHLFGALAEFERELIRERIMAGISAARARGLLGGRPKSLNEKQIKRLREMHADKNIRIQEICKCFSISRASIYNYLRKDVK